MQLSGYQIRRMDSIVNSSTSQPWVTLLYIQLHTHTHTSKQAHAHTPWAEKHKMAPVCVARGRQ